MLKASFKATLALFCILLFITSCSRKKDNFVSRNFHAVTAEFNALYNGYNALEEGRDILNESYRDNYWEVLPIERLEIRDEIVLAGESENENFTRAEEKAVKAIQKHGMDIQGKERNPQIDEAYLLLGKARYFDQRFVPALEAFNFILYKYPASDKINQAKIWREKANIRLENDELAIKNLTRLVETEELDRQDLADATSMLAQAYLNTKQVDSAIVKLEIASESTKNNDERGRYRFIQGQLYNQLGYKDSANIAFDKVIELNRKTPRIYLISAHIEKAKNFDYTNGNSSGFLEHLTDLEENRENRPYLDKIYYQIGDYHLNSNSDSLAKRYFNKSLRTATQDKPLKARSYEVLGDMSFDASEYKNAGAYYDSTMNNLVENSKPYRTIKRKRDNLEDVIYYEDIAQVNDSILQLVNMSDAERTNYFQSFINDLKAKAEEEAEKAEIEERMQGLQTVNTSISQRAGGIPNRGGIGGGPGAPPSATFYFYNPTTVAYGKNEFIKVWGNRALEDNWKWANKAGAQSSTNPLQSDEFANATEEELYDPEFYISKIPVEEKAIDSIVKERNFAYYQLGLIYKEKFKEYRLAKSKLQTLLNSNPEDRLILPAKYNLYKIYQSLGENGEAEIAKNEIVANYPDSRYTTILTNPELASLKDENSPESLYENTYKLHEAQEYAKVISECDKYITGLEGDAIVPKFELLKATASGRLHGYEAYAKAINFIALNYPNSDEGKQAENISTNVLSRISDKTLSNDNARSYKAIYSYNDKTLEEAEAYRKVLDSTLKNTSYRNSKTSVDVYNPETIFVIVHDFSQKEEASTFNLILDEEDRKKIKSPDFVISSENYQVIQIHKNLGDYLNSSNN